MPAGDRGAIRTRSGWARRRWRDLSLRGKGLVVIALPLLIVLADCGALILIINQQAQVDGARQRAALVQRASTDLLAALLNAETGVRGYLASGEPRFLDSYQLALTTLPGTSARLQAQGHEEGDAAQLPQIDSLTQRETGLLASLRASVPGSARTELLSDGKEIMDTLREQLAKIDGDATARTNRRNQQAAHHRTIAVLAAGLSVPLSLAGGLLAMLLFTTGVIRRTRAVQDNAERLGRGEALKRSTAGHDELGRLDTALRQAADLLTSRQQQLLDATAQAEAANHAKTEFLSRMSHELRTPLNAVLGFGQLLEIEATTLDDQESVAQILKGGRHLLELINEVLDLSRIESGQMGLSLEPVGVVEVVTEVLDLMAPIAAHRDVRIDATGMAGCDVYVQADRQRFKQVLLNVVSNAIKYDPIGGSVTLTCQHPTPDRLRVLVRDSGPGIGSENLQRLFTPFDRLGADETGIEGTGLGLALSKRLTEAMHGTIGVESTVGAGSTFWIELALSQPRAPTTQTTTTIPAAVQHTTATILYIEDNFANLRLLERLLADRPGIRLIPALQGQLGLDLAVQHLPDLILLDLHLPDLDGEQVLHRLKENTETRHIPVVILTADAATPGRLNRLLDAGAGAYLTKPLNLHEVLSIIDHAPGHKRQPAAQGA